MRGDNFGDFFYKIVLIGDSGVGKSCLLSRFTYNEFHAESKSTIGVDFATKSIMLEGKVVKAQIWDTAGQERFKAISRVFYSGAAAGMVTYDMTRMRSFSNVQKWLEELQNNADPEMVLMLVGNKSDLKHLRAVSKENGDEFAKEHKMMFIETSALNSENVEEAFYEVIRQIHKNKLAKRKAQQQKGETDFVQLNKADNIQKKEENTEKCCQL